MGWGAPAAGTPTHRLLRLLGFILAFALGTEGTDCYRQVQGTCTVTCGEDVVGLRDVTYEYTNTSEACLAVQMPEPTITSCLAVSACNYCQDINMTFARPLGKRTGTISTVLLTYSSTRTWRSANGIQLAYSSNLGGWVLTDGTYAVAGIGSSPSLLPFFTVSQTTWTAGDRSGSVSITSFCSSCGSNHYLLPDGLSCNRYREPCMDGESLLAAGTPTSDRVCETLVQENCSRPLLSDSSYCIQCPPGLLLVDGVCSNTCPDELPILDTYTQTCRLCRAGHFGASCVACSNDDCLYCDPSNSTICTQCYYDDALSNGQCELNANTYNAPFYGSDVNGPLIMAAIVEALSSSSNLAIRARSYTDITDGVVAELTMCDRTTFKCYSDAEVEAVLTSDNVTAVLDALNVTMVQPTTTTAAPNSSDLASWLRRNRTIIIIVCIVLFIIILAIVLYLICRNQGNGPKETKLNFDLRRKKSSNSLEIVRTGGYSDDFLERNYAALAWYQQNEFFRASGVDMDGNAQPWMMGIVSARRVEFLLGNQTDGAFCVRVSAHNLCLVLNVSWNGSVWHFPIEMDDELDEMEHGYRIYEVGTDFFFPTLESMIDYHMQEPLLNNVLLTYAVCDGGMSFWKLIDYVRELDASDTESQGPYYPDGRTRRSTVFSIGRSSVGSFVMHNSDGAPTTVHARGSATYHRPDYPSPRRSSAMQGFRQDSQGSFGRRHTNASIRSLTHTIYESAEENGASPSSTGTSVVLIPESRLVEQDSTGSHASSAYSEAMDMEPHEGTARSAMPQDPNSLTLIARTSPRGADAAAHEEAESDLGAEPETEGEGCKPRKTPSSSSRPRATRRLSIGQRTTARSSKSNSLHSPSESLTSLDMTDDHAMPTRPGRVKSQSSSQKVTPPSRSSVHHRAAAETTPLQVPFAMTPNSTPTQPEPVQPEAQQQSQLMPPMTELGMESDNVYTPEPHWESVGGGVDAQGADEDFTWDTMLGTEENRAYNQPRSIHGPSNQSNSWHATPSGSTQQLNLPAANADGPMILSFGGGGDDSDASTQSDATLHNFQTARGHTPSLRDAPATESESDTSSEAHDGDGAIRVVDDRHVRVPHVSNSEI
ncbi:uncharacterized protein MONBRDRAFT_33995 [Monosiga brevicollis MX1]|uniref:SH2 domain-containing protein n=1 Tax=Monosiga brevicollis TaxID=81824 RepID=A9V904_MONBE|nr:uncharacterized protein MONBRDRAFT_33995 [Monosiga brevicollis MX1]EDQ86046.1 predicted protein [Monosiga brevicollis MX1]|eukprot:XP_001749240.1 hypothetical protein [Monosiga brevicollis MX1]